MEGGDRDFEPLLQEEIQDQVSLAITGRIQQFADMTGHIRANHTLQETELASRYKQRRVNMTLQLMAAFLSLLVSIEFLFSRKSLAGCTLDILGSMTLLAPVPLLLILLFDMIVIYLRLDHINRSCVWFKLYNTVNIDAVRKPELEEINSQGGLPLILWLENLDQLQLSVTTLRLNPQLRPRHLEQPYIEQQHEVAKTYRRARVTNTLILLLILTTLISLTNSFYVNGDFYEMIQTFVSSCHLASYSLLIVLLIDITGLSESCSVLDLDHIRHKDIEFVHKRTGVPYLFYANIMART